MKTNIRIYLVVSTSLLSIGNFVASVSFAQNSNAPIPACTAISVQKKSLPNLIPSIAVRRDLQTGTITQVFPQGALNVYDHGDPTSEEQYELELINRARANPSVEGDLLFSTTDPSVVNQYQQWKTPTRAQVKADFIKYSAKPPLAFNKSLIEAARIHSQDMLDHNFQDHPGTDGSSPSSRMQKAGYNFGFGGSGENVFAYGNNTDEINQEFEIDFGNPGLGHRTNLINISTFIYTEIGIGMLHGGTGLPNVGPVITTEDFGSANIFITGVVYGDDNQNNFYDIGEGISGATITVSDGSGSAVSSTSGGYAIPFTAGAGTVTVTASGGLLTSPISHQVNLSDVNIKVDFIQGSTGLPDQTQAIFPIADTVHSDTVQFKWNAVTGSTKYRFQLATDPLMKKLISNDSSLTSAMKNFGALKDTTKYYWRVQARNSVGWGQYSPVIPFYVALPLKSVLLLAPANGANTGLNDITLSWHNTKPTANDYWVEVSASNTMRNPIHSDTLTFLPDTVITYPFADFLPATTYYWRVRAENENGLSAPSAIWSFTTGGTSSVPYSLTGANHIMVSPNPTSGQTHIRFSLERSADVLFKVFGVTGREESFSDLGKLQPHSYDIIWNASGKAPGVYIYDLSVSNKHETGRIIVIK